MKTLILSLAVLFAGLQQAQAQVPPQEVTIYSVYESERLAPIFKPFTERTGIKVNIVVGTSDELYNKLIQEGDATTADLYLDKDIVYLGRAQEAGLLQKFNSPTIEAKVPGELVDADKNWMLIFYRARILVYNPTKVNASELSTYEDLGSDKWKGRLCVRTSQNSYNEALSAYFIKHHGFNKTTELFSSWVKNFAVEPLKGDREVIAAVAEGTCDVGVANSYYLAPFIKADPNYKARPFFPNQKEQGTHINGVGIGLTKATVKNAAANMVLEYLTSKEVQTIVAAGFSQYPVSPEATISDTLVSFGPFKQDRTNLGAVAPHTDEGKEAMRQAGYK